MTDAEHFHRTNESLYNCLQSAPEFRRTMQTMYLGVVDHVQPNSNGRVSERSPPDMTCHHGNRA